MGYPLIISVFPVTGLLSLPIPSVLPIFVLDFHYVTFLQWILMHTFHRYASHFLEIVESIYEDNNTNILSHMVTLRLMSVYLPHRTLSSLIPRYPFLIPCYSPRIPLTQ